MFSYAASLSLDPLSRDRTSVTMSQDSSSLVSDGRPKMVSVSHTADSESFRDSELPVDGEHQFDPAAIFQQWSHGQETQWWTRFLVNVENTSKMIGSLSTAALKDPEKFRQLLVDAGSPYAFSNKGDQDNPAALYERCMIAFSLSVFGAQENGLRELLTNRHSCKHQGAITVSSDVAKDRDIGKDMKAKAVSRLLWVLHYLLRDSPKSFPILRSVMGHQGKAGTAPSELQGKCILDVAEAMPGILDRLLQAGYGFPFARINTFLECFAITQRGCFVPGDSDSRKVIYTRTDEPSVDSIYKVLLKVEDCLAQKKGRNEAATLPLCDACIQIESADAQDIALSVFRTHPQCWDSIRVLGIDAYNNNADEIQKAWEEQSANPQGRKNKLRVTLFKELNNNISPDAINSDEESEDGDGMTFLDQTMNRKALHAFLESHNVVITKAETKSQARKNTQHKESAKVKKAKQFQPNLRKHALALAAHALQKDLLNDGRPLDIQLESGLKMWEAELEFVPTSECREPEWTSQGQLEVQLLKLGDGGAPHVFLIDNAFSEEFLTKDREVINAQPMCQDTKSDGGQSSIGAFFRCPSCHQEGGECQEERGETFQGPLMKVGKNNSVATLPASDWESHKMSMATEVCNRVIDYANQVLAAIHKQLVMERRSDGDVTAGSTATESQPGEDNVAAAHGAEATEMSVNKDVAAVTVTEPAEGSPAAADVDASETAPLAQVQVPAPANGDVAANRDVVAAAFVTQPDEGNEAPPDLLTTVDPRSAATAGEDEPDPAEVACLVNRDKPAQDGDASHLEVPNPLFLLSEEELGKIVTDMFPQGFCAVDHDPQHHGLSPTEIFESDCKPIPRFFANAVIVKLGKKAKYHLHQDASYALNSILTKLLGCVANEGFLPYRSEMMVFTIVTGLGSCKAELKWMRDGSKIGSVMTTGNCVHLQLPGVQDDNIMHQSDFVDKEAARRSAVAGQAECRRGIYTYRCVLCPICDHTDYSLGIELDDLGHDKRKTSKPWRRYCLVNAMGPGIRQEVDTIVAPINDLPDDATRPTKRLKTKDDAAAEYPHKVPMPSTFGKMPKPLSRQPEPTRKLKKPPRTVGLPQPLRKDQVSHHELVRKAVQLGLVFRIEDSDEQRIMDQPLFLANDDHVPGGRLFVPGEEVAFDQLPLAHSSTQTCVVDPKHPICVVFVHAYKNEHSSFDAVRSDAVKTMELSCKMKEHEDVLESLPEDGGDSDASSRRLQATTALTRLREEFIAVDETHDAVCANGFAGSMQKQDLTIPSARKMQPSDPTILTGFTQKTSNPENAAFEVCREKGRVLAVFVCDHTWGCPSWLPPKKDKTKRGKAKAGDEQLTEETNALDEDPKVSPKDMVRFIGYMHVAESKSCTFTREEIKQRFPGDDMQKYYYRNLYNVSHMREGCLVYKLKKVFSPQDTLEAYKVFRNRLEPRRSPVFEDVTVWNGDKRCLQVSQESVVASQERERADAAEGVPDADRIDPPHIAHISSCNIRQLLCDTLNTKESFREMFESQRDENLGGFLHPETYHHSLTVKDAAIAAMHVQAAAALRALRECSTKQMPDPKDSEQQVTVATPLVGGTSDWLPDSLRMTPLPCSNSDLDVATQFTVMQGRKLLEHVFNIQGAEDRTFVDPLGQQHQCPEHGEATLRKLAKVLVNKGTREELVMSYEITPENLRDPAMCHVLTNVIFMASITVFTGKVPALVHYISSTEESMNLPTMAESDRYNDFLSKTKAGIASQQFLGMIPPKLKTKSRAGLNAFFKGLATADAGYKRVYNFLLAKGAQDRLPVRFDLQTVVMECLDKCGDIQGDEKKLKFLGNKILSAVDSLFPGFAGEVTEECIALGFGSAQGIDSVSMKTDCRADGDQQEDGLGLADVLPEDDGPAKDRLVRFHRLLVAYLLRRSDDFRTASGWRKNDSGQLESLSSGRLFGLNDTEHMLCKVWLCIIHSHATRNISEEKQCSMPHCHALPDEQDWEKCLTPIMKQIWTSFEKVCLVHDKLPQSSKPDAVPQRIYKMPSILLFDHEKRSEGARIETLLKKAARQNSPGGD